MLDKTFVKVFCNIGVRLLFKCSLLPFKCSNFKFLERSINKTFLLVQISVKHLFTSFFFAIKQPFHVKMFEMVTPCLSLSKLCATSAIYFAIRPGDRSKLRSFVPMEIIKWSGFSFKVGFKLTFKQLTLTLEKCLKNIFIIPRLHYTVISHHLTFLIMLSRKYSDFLTFILIFLTFMFCSYRSRIVFTFLFCLSSLSLYIIVCFWDVFFCIWFFFRVFLFASAVYYTFHRFRVKDEQKGRLASLRLHIVVCKET